MSSEPLDKYVPAKRAYTLSGYCEHCDNAQPKPVRNDDLRGVVCKDCDGVLDEMARCDKE